MPDLQSPSAGLEPIERASVDELRAQGQLGVLTRALTTQAWAAVHLARLPTAVAAAMTASAPICAVAGGGATSPNASANANIRPARIMRKVCCTISPPISTWLRATMMTKAMMM